MKRKKLPPSANTKRLFTINLVIATELNILVKKGVSLSPFEAKLRVIANQLVEVFRYKAPSNSYVTIMKILKEEIEDKSYTLELSTSSLIYGLMSLLSSHNLKLYWEILPKELQYYSESIDTEEVYKSLSDFITFHKNIANKHKSEAKMFSTIKITKRKKEKKKRNKIIKKVNTFHDEVRAKKKDKNFKKRKARKQKVVSILQKMIAEAKGENSI